MSEHTVFECDVSGERYRAKNFVLEVDVRRCGPSPFATTARTVHIATDVLDERVRCMTPSGLDYVGVEEGEIVGASMRVGTNDHPQWEERGSVLLEAYEDLFEFIEEEVLF